LACGTDASGVCVAGVLAGKTDRKVTIHLLGGDLELLWVRSRQSCLYDGPGGGSFLGRMA
jgi:diaminopimelate epimerase